MVLGRVGVCLRVEAQVTRAFFVIFYIYHYHYHSISFMLALL